jgi:ATP-dependent helicase HrpA
MNIRVVDDEGRTIASGRSLEAVRANVGSAAVGPISRPGVDPLQRTGATHWDFGAVPERVALLSAGVEMTGYPALVDEGSTVGLRIFSTPEEAELEHRAGVRRLFVLQVREELAMHVEYLPAFDQMRLHAATLMGGDDLKHDMVDLVADRVFLRDDAMLRTAAEFSRRLDGGWDQLWTTASSVAEVVTRVLALHHDVDVRLTGLEDNAFLREAVQDMRQQLRFLLPRHSLVQTPWKWLTQFPRYLNAVVIRIQKLNNAGVRRDHDATMIIGEFWQRYAERHQANMTAGRIEPALDEFRWSIEELRVSLFAQELRTSTPVSQQRLEKTWSALQG